MKFRKTISALFAAAIVAASFAGCGENPGATVSQVGSSAANMTPSEILKAAKNASTKVENQAVQAKMNAVMKMTVTAEGQTADMNMSFDADLNAHENPLAIAADVKADMDAIGQGMNLDMSVYMLEEDGKCAVYMNAGNVWQKQVFEMDSPEVKQIQEQYAKSFHTDTFTDSFLSGSRKFENKGIRKVNGKDAVVLEGEISVEEMADALKSAGVEDQFASFNLALNDVKTKSGIQVTACYDAETYLPMQIRMDMTDFCSEMMQSMMSATLSSAADASINVEQYTMSVDILACGKDVPEIVLPTAAANAATT